MGKTLKIRAQMAPNVVLLQEMAPNVCRKTHEDLFLEVTPKNGPLWEKSCWQKSHKKTFRQSLEKFGQKSFSPPKICLLVRLCTD